MISKPELKSVYLTASDKFVILASEGVWTVLSSQEVVELVCPYWSSGQTETAAEVIRAEAVHRWTVQGSRMDDITVIVALL